MKNLVEELIKRSVEFSCNQISYIVTKDNILITGNGSIFHPTSIIAMLENITGISQYLRYNRESKEIELVIFWGKNNKN